MEYFVLLFFMFCTAHISVMQCSAVHASCQREQLNHHAGSRTENTDIYAWSAQNYAVERQLSRGPLAPVTREKVIKKIKQCCGPSDGLNLDDPDYLFG